MTMSSVPGPTVEDESNVVSLLDAEATDFDDVVDEQDSWKRRLVRNVIVLRSIYAYWVTWRVVWSYVWLRFRSPFMAPERHRAKLAALHIRSSVRLRQLIEDLRGLFIKIGQMVSVLANFLPEEFRTELEGLQDRVPPRTFKEMRTVLESELGGPVEDHFVEIRPHAVAAASLGQVHVARLSDGQKVAVKIQYPGVEGLVTRDLKILGRMIKIVGFFFPQQGLYNVHREMKGIISEELNFWHEAENLTEVAGNFADDPVMVFPDVIWSHSTRRVLTCTWMDGVKITRVTQLDALGLDRHEIAVNLLHAYCKQIFHHGRYHADPHPGNILVMRDGRIALIDFGAVCGVSSKMREGMVEYLRGALNQDVDAVFGALRKMGFVAPNAKEERFEEVIRYFQDKVADHVRLETLKLDNIRLKPETGREILADLRHMHLGLRELGEMFKVPREWVLLERTIILLTGICTVLDPKLEPVAIVGPYAEEFVLGEERDWSSFMVETGRDWLIQAVGLPMELRKVLKQMAGGRTRVRLVESREFIGIIGMSAKVVGYGILTAGLAIATSISRASADEVWSQLLISFTGLSAFLFLVSLMGLRKRLK